jgi:hypothetical protein
LAARKISFQSPEYAHGIAALQGGLARVQVVHEVSPAVDVQEEFARIAV